MTNPFTPIGSTSNIAVTATSQVLLVPSIGNTSGTLRIINSGSQTIFLNFGSSAAVATVAAGMPMLPNTVETFASGQFTHIAVIAPATGSTLYITSGAGV